MKPVLFLPGRLVATPGALDALAACEQAPGIFLARHIRGDWGIVSADDKRLNAEAVQGGDRILSAYETAQGVKLWIITEADRSATTILLPSEY